MSAALSCLLPAFAAAAPALAPGFPLATQDVFDSGYQGPAEGRAVAIEPGRDAAWIGGSASVDFGQPRVIGFYGRLEESDGRLAQTTPVELGASGQCTYGSVNYCQSGSSASVAGIAFDGAGRIWAAATHVAAGGASKLMFVQAAQPEGGSPLVLADNQTGAEARGVAAAGATAWIAGVAGSRAVLWAAGDWGLQRAASDDGRANAVAVDANGDVWVAGRGAAGGLALWKHDPLSGTFLRVDWANTLGGAHAEGLAVAARGGAVWIAGKADRLSGDSVAALWKWESGALTLVAVSDGAAVESASGLSIDDAGTAWLSGSSGSGYALWRRAPGGGEVLESQATQGGAAGAAVATAGARLVVAGRSGMSLSVWSYALAEGTLSGTLTTPGGFSGGMVFFFMSRDPYFMGNAVLTALPAPASGPTFLYTASLPAPATYHVAAIYSASGELPDEGTGPGNPQNLRLDPFFVPAGGGATGADLSLRLDSGAPTPSFTLPVNGSTIAAASFSPAGSLADDTGVADARAGVQELLTGKWLENGVFVSTPASPYLSLRPQVAGLPAARTWSLGALGAAVVPGRRYAVHVLARDFPGYEGTAVSTVLIASTAASSGNGMSLRRSADGSLWVLSRDASTVTLAKHDSAGALLGSIVVPGAVGGDGEGPRLAFDAAGNAWVAASSATGLGVWKVSPMGELLAQGESPAAGQVIVGGIEIGAAGDVWVAGVAQVGEEFRHAVWRFDLSALPAPGYPLLTARGGGVDGALSAALDASGVLWSAGVSSNPATGKLDAALWKHASDGSVAAAFPVYSPDAFGSLESLDVAMTAAPSGGVWLAFSKSFASCGADTALALVRASDSGVIVSTSFWQAASGGAQPRALATDAAGRVWAVGKSGGQTALWSFSAAGELAGGYPQLVSSSQQRGLALDAAGTPWILAGATPVAAAGSGPALGASGAPACSLVGQGRLSGTISYAAGFSGGETITVVASTDDFRSDLQFFNQVSAPAGTQAPYFIDLPAPSTYTVAAFVEADPEQIDSMTPIGAAAFFPAAIGGQETAGVDFTVAPDAAAPEAVITSLVPGATVLALSTISGTATDNTGVGEIIFSFALHDLTADLWWNPGQGQWQSTRSQDTQRNAATSGPRTARRWSMDLVADFNNVVAHLGHGRRYRAHAAARDFSRNVQSPEAEADFIWGGPEGQVTPPAPSFVNGLALNVSSIQWNWGASEGAASYKLYDDQDVLLFTTTSTFYLQSGLGANARRVLCVAAVNAFGEGAKRCSAPVYTFPARPPTPYAAGVTTNSVSVGWIDAQNPPDTRYQVVLATAPDETSIVMGLNGVFPSATTTFFNLQPDTVYYVALVAYNGANQASDFSDPVSTRTLLAPPLAPFNFAGAALGVSSVSWTWVGAPSTQYFEVLNAQQELISTTTSAAYVATGLAPASQSVICARGVNAAGSGPSNCGGGVHTRAAVPGAPELQAATSSSLYVLWDAAGSQQATFELSLSLDAFAATVSTPVPFSAQFGGNAYFLEGLQSATTYYLRVRARNAEGVVTDFSATAGIRTKAGPPNAPEALYAVADVPERRIHLTWQAPSSGSAAALYNLYRASPPSTSAFVALAEGLSGTTYDDAPFFSATYYYRVSAVNADALEGPLSAVALAALDLQAPPAVADFRVSAVRASAGEADLAWTASEDELSGVSRYFVLESPNQDFAHPASTRTVAAQPGTVTYTVQVSTQRASHFVVRAEDGAGNLSLVSNAATVDVLPPSFTFLDLYDGAVLQRPRLFFASASDDLGVSRLYFRVDGLLVEDLPASSHYFFWDTRLLPDGQHTLEVEARDAAGNSSYASRFVTVNYAPPSPPSIYAPSSGFTTKVSTINVFGTAEPYVSVQLQANNLDLATATVVSGQWSVVPATFAAEGDIALTAIAYESRGFSAPSNAVHGVYAASAPNPPELVSAQPLSNGRARLAWSAPSTVKTPTSYRIYRSLDDALLLEGQPVPSLRIASNVQALAYEDAPSAEDLYFYAVASVDGAGNESDLSDVVYALTDRTPPVATVQFSTPQPVGVGVYRPVFSLSEPLLRAPVATLTDPSGRPAALALEALSPVLWRATAAVTSDFGQGTAAFGFEGTDLAGNVGTSALSRFLQVDTVGPTGSLSLSKSSPVGPGVLTLTLTLDEPAGQTPVLTVAPFGQAAVAVSLTQGASAAVWTGDFTIGGATGNGEARLAFSASDALGNAGSALVSGTTVFMIDTVAPGAPLAPHANPLPQGRIALSWSAAPGEKASYYAIYRDAVLLSTHVPPAADFTGSYVDSPSEAAHAYRVAAVDAAANESALSAEVSATADATPPSAPTSLTVGLNGFGQVQLDWQSGGADTAHYALYRATHAITTLAGLIPRSAVPPFVDNPTFDAEFHYVVTGLDAVLNESAASNEVSITYDRAAPVISVTGVSHGALYAAPVSPAFSVTDGNLDNASIRARLDGASFLSGSQVSAEGVHSLVIDAADLEGHRAASTTTFTLDFTAPQLAFSVQNGALLQSTAGVSVSISVSDLHAGASSFLLYNAVTQTTAPYLTGGTILANGRYTLTATATDQAGNENVAFVSFRASVMPAKPQNLSVVVGSSAKLSWTSPQPDVVGYRVYRDNARVSASLHASSFFDDFGWTPGAHVYEVSCVDEFGVEGPRQRASIPPATLGFEAHTLTRGFFDALRPTVRNDNLLPLIVGPAELILTDTNGLVVAANAPAVSIVASATGKLEGVVATPVNFADSATMKAKVAVPTDSGASVFLDGSFRVTAVEPVLPILEVLPGALVPNTLSPVQVRLYNRGSAAMDVITAEINGGSPIAARDVTVEFRTLEGTLLESGRLQQTTGGVSSALLSQRQVYFMRVPAGGNVLFDPVPVLVPNASVSTVSVVAIVSTPTFSLPFMPIGGAREYRSSLAQAMVGQIPYFASVQAERATYDQQEEIHLNGRTFDSTNVLLPMTTATIHILSNGFERKITAVSDEAGLFTATFVPIRTESGVYSLFASHPDVVTQSVQSSFTIVGFGLQYPSFNASVAQNSSLSFVVDLTNTGATEISGLTASSESLSGAGVTLSMDPSSLPQSLAASARATLKFTLSANPSAVSSELRFTVTEAHGFARSLPISATVVPAQAIPTVNPQAFQLGLMAGQIRSQVVTLENKGFDTWRGVSLSSPSLSWVKLQGLPTIGDIPPGGNANFVISFEPPIELPNGTYVQNPLVEVYSLNAATIPINTAIAITSSRNGSIAFNIINADKPRAAGGQGVPIGGAVVTLVSLDISGLNFTVPADLNGFAQLSNVPSGNYAWSARAPGFQPRSGTISLESGLTKLEEILLVTATITYEWSVTPTTIVDRYDILLNLTFKTDVPAPIIIIDPTIINIAAESHVDTFGQLTVTNRGFVSAFNVKLVPDSPDGEVLIDLAVNEIQELRAQETVVVPYRISHGAVAPGVPHCHNAAVNGTYFYPCAAGIPTSGKCEGMKIKIGNACPVGTGALSVLQAAGGAALGMAAAPINYVTDFLKAVTRRKSCSPWRCIHSGTQYDNEGHITNCDYICNNDGPPPLQTHEKRPGAKIHIPGTDPPQFVEACPDPADVARGLPPPP